MFAVFSLVQGVSVLGFSTEMQLQCARLWPEVGLRMTHVSHLLQILCITFCAQIIGLFLVGFGQKRLEMRKACLEVFWVGY